MQRNITVQSTDNKGLRVHPYMEHLLHPFHQGSGFRQHHRTGDGENERLGRREECDEMLSSGHPVATAHMSSQQLWPSIQGQHKSKRIRNSNMSV